MVYGVILPLCDLDVFEERPSILVALLKRLNRDGCNEISVTFDELANECGYANRSGAWKHVQKLIKQDVVEQVGRGTLLIKLRMVV
jgi:DNA-binding IclR family transcriptional regulator